MPIAGHGQGLLAGTDGEIFGLALPPFQLLQATTQILDFVRTGGQDWRDRGQEEQGNRQKFSGRAKHFPSFAGEKKDGLVLRN